MPGRTKNDKGNSIPRAREYVANFTGSEHCEHKAHNGRRCPPGTE